MVQKRKGFLNGKKFSFTELINQGVRVLDETRGVQVKQQVQCLKHKTVFNAIPALYLQNTYKWGCFDCGKEAIDDGIALMGVSAFKHSELYIYALQAFPRYTQHTHIRIDFNEKLYFFYCTLAEKEFSTKNPLSEMMQSQQATGCPSCKEAIRQEKIQKIQIKNAPRYEATLTSDKYVYTDEGKCCKIHGPLKSIKTVGKRCAICEPAKHSGTFKWKSPQAIENATFVANTLNLPFRFREDDGHMEVLICQTHQSYVDAPFPKTKKLWDLSKIKCPICLEQALVDEAKTIVHMRYPDLIFFDIELIPRKKRFVYVTTAEFKRLFSLADEKFVIQKPQHQPVKTYIKKENFYYGT